MLMFCICTWVEFILCCRKTQVFAFVSSAVSTLNLWYYIIFWRTLITCFFLLCEIAWLHGTHVFGGCCLILLDSHYNSILFSVFSQVSAWPWPWMFRLLKSLIILFSFIYLTFHGHEYILSWPIKSSFWLLWHFHGPKNLMAYGSWPIKFNFYLFMNFHGHEKQILMTH